MRVKTIFLIATVVVVFITAVKLLSDHATVLAKLPENRVEHARREELQKPFLSRSHRLERKARLESVSDSQPPAAGADPRPAKKRVGTTMSSQRLQKTNLESSEDEQKRAKYHVVPSVDGGVYTEWQIRICYYQYKKIKQEHPDSAMGGFTRLLHSGKEDSLMDEIPTVVVDPLPPGVDQGYVVLNRPYAFLQWVRRALPSIPEDYVLMAEPDHLFVRPMPLWATPSRAAAYPFTYIAPRQNADLLNRFNDRGVSAASMAPIGNAPVQIHRRQLESIVEIWHNVSLRMKNDADVDKAFGWVLEMYAYSVASSQPETGPIAYELRPDMMVQPPFDSGLEVKGKPTALVHLTYGMDYDTDGKMVYGSRGKLFHWDKRDYSHTYPPRNLPMPPDGVDAPAVRFLLAAINEASAGLPWPVTNQTGP